MRKILSFLVVNVCLVMALSAQLAIGGTAAVYSDQEMSSREFIATMQAGEGLNYGPFIELGLGKISLGFAGNMSRYQLDLSAAEDGSVSYAMRDYDFNFYGQYHLFEYGSFLDVFGELGIGRMERDFAIEAQDTDLENPLLATEFFQAGGGFGINLGKLGVFFKGLYMMPTGDPVTADYVVYDKEGSEIQGEYALSDYPLKKLKLILGLRLIL